MDKLRKENEKLRTDLQATKEEVEKLSKLVTCKSQDGTSSCSLSPGQSKSVDFISSQYDGIMEQLQSIKAKLNDLDHRCNELRLAIDEMQAYSYQYNIKIFGLPTFERTQGRRLIMYTVVLLNGSEGCFYARYGHNPPRSCS